MLFPNLEDLYKAIQDNNYIGVHKRFYWWIPKYGGKPL